MTKRRNSPAPIIQRSGPGQIRLAAADTDNAPTRTFTGIAVPYGETIDYAGQLEVFEPGSIRMAEQRPVILWQHDTAEPVGVLVDTLESPAGFQITARISETQRGNDAYQLMQDGILDRLSIGFRVEPNGADERDGIIHYTNVTVREISLVTFPAYPSAQISTVRTQPREEPQTMDPEQLAAIQAQLAEQQRTIDTLRQPARPTATSPLSRYRSFGEYVRASAADPSIRAWVDAPASGDSDSIYEGGRPQWAGLLETQMRALQRVTNAFTHTYTLPPRGLSLEYAEINDHTVVAAQTTATPAPAKESKFTFAGEGDDLAYGYISVTPKVAPIRTYGGWSQLSRQVVERMEISAVDILFQALAGKYAGNIEQETKQLLSSTITEYAEGLTLDPGSNGGSWSEVGNVVENIAVASEYFDEEAKMPLDGLIVSRQTYIDIVKSGSYYGGFFDFGQTRQAGFMGSADPVNRTANTFGIPVIVANIPGMSDAFALAYNSTALRVEESPGAPFRLDDDDVVGLHRGYSVYGYASHALPRLAGLRILTGGPAE